VVDDGSTDPTPQVLAGFGGRIRVIRQDNAGASAARNAGILAAQSDWIAFLDGDDEWLPEAIAQLGGIVQRHPELVWATGNFFRCDCDAGHRQWEDITPPRMEAFAAPGRRRGLRHFVAHNLGRLYRHMILAATRSSRQDVLDKNASTTWICGSSGYRHPAIGFVQTGRLSSRHSRWHHQGPLIRGSSPSSFAATSTWRPASVRPTIFDPVRPRCSDLADAAAGLTPRTRYATC
jgi:glycosyltransferase involved in cell wall biosynthesis